MNLIAYVLTAYGMTFIIVYGKIFEDIRPKKDYSKNFHFLPTRNKGIVETKESEILNSNFDLVIIDEAHAIKNTTSKRTKLVMDFVKKIKRVWLLTGTPVANRPIDFYNLLKICR